MTSECPPLPPPASLSFLRYQDYLLYYNYWKMNLKDNTIVFPNEGKGGNSDYFG